MNLFHQTLEIYLKSLTQKEFIDHLPTDEFLARIKEKQLILKNNIFAVLEFDQENSISFLTDLCAHLLNNNSIFVVSQKESETRKIELKSFSHYSKKATVILFTSGSSGDPKGYFFSLENIFSTAQKQGQALKINEGDKILLNLPLHHVSGLMLFFRALVMNARLVISKENNELINCEHISFVPTQAFRLLKENIDLSKIRTILIGGAPVSPELKNSFLDINISVYESYGATETLGFALLNNTPLAGIEILINENKTTIFSENLPTVCFKNGLIGKTFFVENGLVLNDELKKDQENKYYFVKRNDLVFQVGGENYSPEFYENLIFDSFFEIKGRIVISFISDQEYQNLPILYYLCNSSEQSDHILEHIKQFCENNIPSFFRPRAYHPLVLNEFFEEKIGRSKIQKIGEKKYLENLFALKDPKSTIVLHGFMGNPDEFSFMNEFASTLSLPFHTQENANFIRNKEHAHFLFSKFLNYLSADIGLLNLIGYSMGGRFILETLMKYPMPIQSLTLISAHLGLNNTEEKNLRLTQDQKLLAGIQNQVDFKKFLNEWYNKDLFYPKNLRPQKEMEALLNKDFSMIDSYKKASIELSTGKGPMLSETITFLKKHLKNTKISMITGTEDSKYYKHYQDVSKNLEDLSKLKVYYITGAYHDLHRSHHNQLLNFLKKI